MPVLTYLLRSGLHPVELSGALASSVLSKAERESSVEIKGVGHGFFSPWTSSAVYLGVVWFCWRSPELSFPDASGSNRTSDVAPRHVQCCWNCWRHRLAARGLQPSFMKNKWLPRTQIFVNTTNMVGALIESSLILKRKGVGGELDYGNYSCENYQQKHF